MLPVPALFAHEQKNRLLFALSWGAATPETGRLILKTQHLAVVLAVLRAKIKIKMFRIRAGIGPKPTISLGQWQSKYPY